VFSPARAEAKSVAPDTMLTSAKEEASFVAARHTATVPATLLAGHLRRGAQSDGFTGEHNPDGGQEA
jgi:hypothetical protein